MDRRCSTRRPRVISIPVHFVQSEHTKSASALKIQKTFRGFLVRKHVKQIKTILRQVVEIEGRIDSVKEIGRIDDKERLRLNETLMSLLLKLDSVRGICNGVRDCRKRVIKKAIGLQEKVDSIPSVTVVSDFEPDLKDRVVVEETPKTIDSTDAASVILPDQVQIEFEQETKTDALSEKEDQVVADEEKHTMSLQEEAVSEIKSDQSAMEEEEEPKTIHCVMEDELALPECVDEGDDNGDGTDGKNPVEAVDVTMSKKGEGDEEMELDKDRKRGRDLLLEKMAEENEKLVEMMKELNEKNEIQMRLLNSLAQRVELLEKTVVCDKLARMKKKKRHGCNNNNF